MLGFFRFWAMASIIKQSDKDRRKARTCAAIRAKRARDYVRQQVPHLLLKTFENAQNHPPVCEVLIRFAFIKALSRPNLTSKQR
jgi:hypothetical protein